MKTKSRLSGCVLTACCDLTSNLGGLQGLPAVCSAPGGLRRGLPQRGGWIWGLPLLPSLLAALFLPGHRTEPGNDAARSSSSRSSSSESIVDARQWHGAVWTRVATWPGCAPRGHKATLPAAEIYSSFLPVPGRSPGSPGELDGGAQCCSPSHLPHGRAAAVHGHVVKHRERIETSVWGCNPAL